MTARLYVAFSTFLLLTAARLADIATTRYFNPSLDKEGNPLVFLLGGKWGSLLASTIAVWLLAVIFLFAYWRGDGLKASQVPSSFLGYVRAWTRRVAVRGRPIRASLPGGRYWNEGLQAIRLVGVALPWAVIAGSITAIYSWLATYGSSKRTVYQAIYAALQVGGLNYFTWLTTPLGFALGVWLFFWLEFRESHLAANTSPSKKYKQERR
jgi:hypothetical protein